MEKNSLLTAWHKQKAKNFIDNNKEKVSIA